MELELVPTNGESQSGLPLEYVEFELKQAKVRRGQAQTAHARP